MKLERKLIFASALLINACSVDTQIGNINNSLTNPFPINMELKKEFESLNMNKDFAEIYMLLGNTFFRNQEYDKARKYFSLANEYVPERADEMLRKLDE